MCIVMDVLYVGRNLMGQSEEAELLIKVCICLVIAMMHEPNSFRDVIGFEVR